MSDKFCNKCGQMTLDPVLFRNVECCKKEIGNEFPKQPSETISEKVEEVRHIPDPTNSN